MINSQELYLNRFNRLSKLNFLKEPDFLTGFSDEKLLCRIEDVMKDRDEEQIAALIFGARSNYLYSVLKNKYALIDQFPITKLIAGDEMDIVQQADTVVCSHLIDWLDPNKFLPKAIEAIKPGGELFFSFYGDSTASSLIKLIGAEDSKPYFQPKYAMTEVGDHAAGLGLNNVVLDSERLNLEYSSIEKLLKDAKLIDGANFSPDRRRFLMPKGVYQRILAKLEKQLATEGMLRIEIELCFGRGVKKDNTSVNVGVPTFYGQ